MLEATEKGSISIAFARQALRCADRRGADAARLARAAGLSPSMLDSDAARISPQSFATLWLSIAKALDDEFFGLDRRRMKVGTYAVLCRMSVRCRTLGEALRQIVDFLGVILDDTRLRLSVEDDEARLMLVDVPGRPVADAQERAFAHETLFVLVNGLTCWLIGRRIEIREACFAYAEPAHAREYLSIFCPELRFNAAASSIAFPALHLKAAVAQTERSARQFLRAAPAAFLLKYRNEASAVSRLRRLLRDTAPDDWPPFDRIAAQLGVSASGLRRELEREGTPFLAIKDAMRRDRAIDYLAHSRLGIGDIAAALGYAEPSAFHRAFKKWTGVSPGDYREHRTAAVR
ncbi:MAG: AraC family transcriptional regulator [Nevskia sp.]